MEQNTEASTGDFLADPGAVGFVPQGPEGSDRAYAMTYQIAPAPFDLGVNQTMELYAYFNPRVKAYMLAVHLTRTSGEHSNWQTVNQPFLEHLRKRLLSWRSQTPETHDSYYRAGDALFEGAGDLTS
jgi:hypothetical protein